MEFRADRWSWTRSAPRNTSERGWALRRRGVSHGFVRRLEVHRLAASHAGARWRDAEPIHLRRALATDRVRAPIARTVTLFASLRAGADFEPRVWRRCSDSRFVPAGASVDLSDPREIERVHADLRTGARFSARDLWAKASWISHDARDASLRIRFSFGLESSDDWRSSPRRSCAADEFCEAVFPEAVLLARHRCLHALLRRWTGGHVRLSERIVFSNAPGGGARFHHDAETDQLGVAYAQLAGRTAWLSLSKRALAAEVAALATSSHLKRLAGTPSKAMRGLESHDDRVDALLNESPKLTGRLIERGAGFVLSAGDVLLLPSHGPDDAAWHSVFALGKRPSLALSFGVFQK